MRQVPKNCLFSGLDFDKDLKGPYNYMVICEHLDLAKYHQYTVTNDEKVHYSDILLKEAPLKTLNINIQKKKKKKKKENWGRSVLGAEMTRGRNVRGAEMTGAEVTGAEVTGAEMVRGRSV